MSEVVDPLAGPVPDGVATDVAPVTAPRMARHRITLEDGHVVGITVAGAGIPLVVINGFSAEGFLYAQTLSRLVNMGFKVIAVDTAGHGGTEGLPSDGHNLAQYGELVGRVIDELGLKQYILAGHSMGGRIVTQLAASRPQEAIAVLLIDAIVGDTWDRMVYAFRLAPPLIGVVGAALLVDSLSLVSLSDPSQSIKLLRLALPTIVGDASHPWRLLGPVISILRSRSSRYALNELANNEVPVFVLHGDRDHAVPLVSSRQAAERARGTMITIAGGGHSWLLRDPEALPAIVAELLDGALGEACGKALRRAGVRSSSPSIERIHRALYEPEARIFSLTPLSNVTRAAGRHRKPKYRWTVEPPE